MENSIKNERSSIEEDIKILEEFKTNGYSILLMKYGDRIKTNFKLAKAIEHILSDYKKVLKENKELQEDRNKFKKALGKRITYCNELEKDLFENGSNYVIPKQIVKDKIEEYDKQRIKMEKDDIGVGFTLGKEWSDLKAKIEALQDFLEKE